MQEDKECNGRNLRDSVSNYLFDRFGFPLNIIYDPKFHQSKWKLRQTRYFKKFSPLETLSHKNFYFQCPSDK